jgi:hypothetical protein
MMLLLKIGVLLFYFPIAEIIIAVAAITSAGVAAGMAGKRARNAREQAIWENENRQLPLLNNLHAPDQSPQLTLLLVVVVVAVAAFFIIKNAHVKNGYGK